MEIGFIGLGNMGLPMARHLLKADHEVTVYNRTRERAESLRADGAAVADQPGDACGSDVLITMLADDRALRAVVLDGQLIPRLAPGAIHVSMSTISVALAQELTQAHAEGGSQFISAPVFGRPEAAEAAKLFVVAAGPARAVEKCRPLFDAMGQRTFVVGEEPSKANTVKLAGNFLIVCVIESLGEAYALLRKSEVEPERFLEVMTSTLFSAPVYKTYGSLIAKEQFLPAGFKLPLGLKDVSLVLAAATDARAPMPVASLVRDHILAAIARNGEDLDWSSFSKISAENAGLK
ncbi:MAG: NAD(P)-dependent oxidoreductase [Acidobacteria bacterium]|nr:MAG: NAD(P)-dependent oxidoreductase [Acidobacteriota bacterium]